MAAGDTLFDLEDPAAHSALSAAPKAVLEPLEQLVVIDEIQRAPGLLPLLRVLADRPASRARFLILGSASLDLVKGASESLAGRVEFVDLEGFSLDEVGPDAASRLWLRGGFPRSFLSASDEDSAAWRESFIRTFLERDIPQLGISVPALQLRRFWTMVAHYHGQTWNHAEVGGSMGVDEKTVRRWLDLLAGAFMVRLLPPWFENVGKRQRKAPKVYLRDSGLLHALLGIRSEAELRAHPRLGASWEGFALEQVLHVLRTRDAYYWSVHAGPELDLLIFDRGKRIGFEVKFQDAPDLTPALRKVRELLGLERLWLVYPGSRRFSLADWCTALPLAEVPSLVA